MSEASIASAPEKPVALVEQRELRLLDAPGGARSRRGVAEPLRDRARSEASRELAAKRRPERLERGLALRFAPAGRRFPGVDGLNQGERIPLGDKRAEPAGDAGQLLEFRGLRHDDLDRIKAGDGHAKPRAGDGHRDTETQSRRRRFDGVGRGAGPLGRHKRFAETNRSSLVRGSFP